MAGVFRLAFHRVALSRPRNISKDWRWSLAVSDPSVGLFSGVFAASDGALIPYRVWPAHRPRALILLLHGAFDYSGAFDEIGPRLASTGLTAFAFDQRGFGATASRGHWCGIERMTDDVGDALGFLRARFGDQPAFIVGESMGADIAVRAIAAGNAGDIRGIVLAAPGAVTDAVRRLLWGCLIRLLGYFAPDSELGIERIKGTGLTAAGAIRLLCDPLVLRSLRPAMAAGLFELAVSAVPAARQVSVPALTMIGSRENLIYSKCISRLHCALSGHKTWRVFAGAPHHLLHWRHSKQVIDEVVAWIEARLGNQVSR
ncbi:MAG TPA: alpha/beta fold hydrolase [Rhizomicrobium sp.]|nr:alpha/beta fold hydrolase [Rhizomicrobium sp.]